MEAPERVNCLIVSDGDKVYMIGGVDTSGNYYSEVWEVYPIIRRILTEGEDTIFTPREGLAGFYWNGGIYVYGGQSQGNLYKDWLRLDLSKIYTDSFTWEVFLASEYEGRQGMTCVYDEEGERAIIYGGSGSNSLSEVLIFQPSNN